MAQTGAQLFVQAVTELGIRRIFTLVGDHLNEVLAEASRAGISILDMRHESGVTHAADAYARLTRRPALSLVTGGPGHTNSLTGIATAQLAASPLIAVSGARATTVAERQAFQDIGQVPMTTGVVKWAGEPPNAGQIPFYLGRAYAEADSGRKGAVHLTIPHDLFTSSAEAPARLPRMASAGPAGPSPADIEKALALLRKAERPVVIAGSGVWWAGAESALERFIERTSLPLYTITMAKGVVSDEHPLVMGYADPALNRAAVDVFKEADLFLVLGKRIDYRLALGGPRLFPAGARFIQVDIHPQELGMNRALELGICADAKATLETMLEALGPDTWAPLGWLDRLREARRGWQRTIAAAACDRELPLHPAAVFAELAKALPRDAFYSWDGGDFTHWGRASMPSLGPGRWLRLGPLATIGSGLPNSLSLQLANPGRPVVLFTGDGSLGFYLAELDTAVRHGLPVVMIVGNDAGWGIERHLQRAAVGGETTVACELRDTQYDIIMKGFGGGGETVDRLEEIAPAAGRAFASGGPYLINIRTRGVRSPFAEWQVMGKKR